LLLEPVPDDEAIGPGREVRLVQRAGDQEQVIQMAPVLVAPGE
jgi:hypothetical protein